MLAYSPYAELQPRVFQNISEFLGRPPAQGRVDPLIYFLVSNGKNRLEAVRQRMIDGDESHMIISFGQDACLTATSADFVIKNIREQLYTRDLYDVEDPIDDDLFFFGRRKLVFNIIDTIKCGSNIGLFGLRKMGKTSVIFKIRRLVTDENLGEFVYFNLKNHPFTRYNGSSCSERSGIDCLGSIVREACGTKNWPLRHLNVLLLISPEIIQENIL